MKDLLFAFRNLRSNPTFSAVAILTIALGIGSVTAIFSVVDAVLLQGLPYEAPEELVRVWSTNAERGVERGFMSPPDIEDIQVRNRTLEDLAAYSEAELALIDPDGVAVKVTGTWAGENLFSVLGVSARLGRTLTTGDGAPGAPQVVVLGDDFWRNRFGADPGIIGQTLTIEEGQYTVVGVMPPTFDFPGSSGLWLNRHLMAYPGRYARWMDVVARLDDGSTLNSAREDVARVARELEQEYPQINRAYATSMVPLHEAVVGETRAPLLILLGATALLLLVACANVINLLLARMADRGQEIALRTALGAGRLRLGRQLLTESFVLSTAGAVLGVLFAWLGVTGLVALGPENLPRLDEVGLDGRVLLFAVFATGATGVLFGMAPLIRLARTDVRSALSDGSRGSTGGRDRGRARNALVVAQLAAAVMLVVGAGLLSRSFQELLDTEPGFDAEGVMTFRVDLPSGAYRDLERVSDFYGEIIEEMAALPGVTAVAATATLPFDREIPFLGDFFVVDRATPEQGEEPIAHYRQVSPSFFSTLGIDLVSGRVFDRLDDRTSKGVAVVNQTLVDRYFPGEDPIGAVIGGLPPHVALGGFFAETFEIVGVVQDVTYFGLAEPPEPSLYLPVAQAPFRRMSFTVRSEGDLAMLVSGVRSAIQVTDQTVPISQVSTLERILSASVARERFTMLLLLLFGGVALVLASVGVYGVISYGISQRTAELGVRLALGAEPGDVLKLVLTQGIRLAVAGVALGLVGAALLSRVITSQLYGVGATDPSTYIAVAVSLLVVAMVAAYIPARRTARLDPVLALQGDARRP
jgi:predicted permease